MGPLYLSEADVGAIADMDLALEAVAAAHRAHGEGRAIDVPRQRTRLPAASLHILQGALPDEGVFGYKAYTASRDGVRFMVHLFDAATGRPLAMIEANRLGMLRTGAASGVAAQCLARPDAAVLGLFGAGWQAEGQLLALSRVRQLRLVKVCSRDEQRCRTFCDRMSRVLGLEVRPAAAEQAVRESDLVATVTTSATPVFDGQWLEPGCHVNAAGSNALVRREIDVTAVRRAAVVCVDSRATALAEAGDLLPLLETGRLHDRQLLELGDLLAGVRRGRTAASDITLFESQGMAIQDLALARRVLEIARTRGMGRSIVAAAD